MLIGAQRSAPLVYALVPKEQEGSSVSFGNTERSPVLRTGEGQPQGANEYRQEGRFVLRRLRTSGLIAYYADQEYRQFASAKRTSE